MKTTYKTIGQSIPKIGVKGRLRGKPIFSADIDPEDALVLRVLRSTRAHAGIVNVNCDRAREIKGVVAIFTSRDVPGKNLTGIINKDQPLLADGKVRSVGEPIALVAAESKGAAAGALEHIEVTYQDLPAVFTPDDALKPDAPKIHAKGNLLVTRRIKPSLLFPVFVMVTSISMVKSLKLVLSATDL